MLIKNRRDIVFVILAGIFITDAVLAELIGGKLIQVGPFAMSIGVIPWPVVFVITDLINEYFGINGVKKLTLITIAMIAYCFVVLYLAMLVPAASFSPVTDEAFSKVFGTSLWIIVGSITAFALSQLVDVMVFWFFRNKTGEKMLWLRATGSTAVSQLIDSIVIIGIAFWLPGKVKTSEFLSVAFTNYSYKFIIAVAMTPVIYLIHKAIDKFLGNKESHTLIEHAAKESLSN